MTNVTIATVPEGFVAETIYYYTLPCFTHPWSTEEEKTFTVCRRDDQFVVDGYHGFHADTLEEIKALIDEHVAEKRAERDEYRKHAGAEAKLLRERREAYAEWEQEQLAQAELVPVKDLMETSVAAVVCKSKVRSDYFIDHHYDDAYFSGKGKPSYKLEIGDHWRDPKGNPVRYIKAGSKVRAIREYTRPAPTRKACDND